MAKTSNLNEDLGRVQYVFSDKTGTLTKNQMRFRCASVGGREVQAGDPPLLLLSDLPREDRRRARNFFRCLALCHSAEVEMEARTETMEEEGSEERKKQEETADGEGGAGARRVYRTPSPDEQALLEFAAAQGFELRARQAASRELLVAELRRHHAQPRERRYELVATLEFSSQRRRMSVLVREPRRGRLLLLCKGADNVVYERLEPGLEPELRERVTEQLRRMSRQGLRTLAVAWREVPEEEAREFLERQARVLQALEDRDAHLEEAYDTLERRLRLLGCTAIEDELAEDVPQTIHVRRSSSPSLQQLSLFASLPLTCRHRTCCGPACACGW